MRPLGKKLTQQDICMPHTGKDGFDRMRTSPPFEPGQSFDFAMNADKAMASDPATDERIKA